MLIWAIYDISSNKKRDKIVKLCKDYGLYRVQKSVFLGTITSNEIDELVLQSKELINEKKDSVYIFPMCNDDFKKVKLLGQAFDKKLVTNEIIAKFF